MQEVTIKKDEQVVLDKEIKLFLNPKFVFLPIDGHSKIAVSDHDYVYKNDCVARKADGRAIYSPISGRVLGLKRMNYFGKSDISSLVIENDCKENVRERKGVRKYINEYTREEFFDLLEKVSYDFKGIDLRKWYQKGITDIIVNTVDLDPSFGNRKYCWLESEENILETCDFLSGIFDNAKIHFAILNTDSELIDRLTSLVGTYPFFEINLIADAYPNGMGFLQRKLLKLEDALSIDLECICDVFSILKREKPITSKLITVTGPAVRPTQIVRVKLGTLLSEVFVNNFDFSSPKIDVYINGTLYGEKVTSLKYVIDESIDGVFIKEKDTSPVEPCLSCGQCSRVCPVGLNPKYVFDHDGQVTPDYYDKCLQCGLCNYVCPANRDLKCKMKGRDSS